MKFTSKITVVNCDEISQYYSLSISSGEDLEITARGAVTISGLLLNMVCGTGTVSFPRDKDGIVALTSDIPNSLSCTPALRRVFNSVTIKAGFNIYANLQFGTSLSYGALYCFGNTLTMSTGSGTFFAPQAIGFRVKGLSKITGESEVGETYAIISTQEFNPTYIYTYALTLS